MHAVPIEYVSVGDILGDTLYSTEGIMLARTGAHLTEALLERIKRNQIYTLYIRDEHSNYEINHLLDPSTINSGMLLIRDIFNAASFRTGSGDHKPQSIMPFMDALNELTDSIIDSIFRSRNQPLEYVVIKNIENYLYMSSLNCGILSALIATSMNYNRERARHLFLAGVFHDIGMAFLPKEIFFKKEALSREEKMAILEHPIQGHRYLKDKTFLSAYVKQAALHHHEKLNGSGYPNRIQGEELTLNSQIIGISDIYDAMTSDRPYSRATPPHEAIEYLLGSAGTIYDAHLVQVFTSRIHPFPPGSLVLLSSGEYAVVDLVPDGLPLRPTVRVIYGSKGAYRYTPVDLASEHTLMITKLVYQLPF